MRLKPFLFFLTVFICILFLIGYVLLYEDENCELFRFYCIIMVLADEFCFLI